jgi:hypothetical protein
MVGFGVVEALQERNLRHDRLTKDLGDSLYRRRNGRVGCIGKQRLERPSPSQTTS